jgi:hypothetical protein
MPPLVHDGGAATREVPSALYPRKAIVETQQAFAQHCRVSLATRPGGRIAVTVAPLSADAAESRATVLEFWNYCLARACEMHLG